MSTFGDTVEIDLHAGVITRRPTPEADVRLVLGGRGLNVLRLLRDGVAGADPSGPDNPLLISLGLLTGTEAPSASRVYISARSPLTGVLGGSSIGGSIGHVLRALGMGSLTFRGRSEKPVYLLVEDERVELRDAGGLWGLDTVDTVNRLATWHDGGGEPSSRTRLAMLVIGPAGENQAPLACIVTGGGHAAGRTGMGAVMGAKRLKAIVIVPPLPGTRGHDGVASATGRTDARASQARAAARRYLGLLKAAPGFDLAKEFGTTDSVLWSNDLGMLPARNFTAAQFAGAAATDGANIEQYVVRTHGCPGCAIRCKADVRVQSGRFEGFEGQRPDFEPLVAWGAKVGVDDPEAVLYLHDRCDRLGLDSISAGAAAAFALDLYARGIIDRRDTDGRELRWGDTEALSELLDDMAARRGLGGLLGGGVRSAARAIGRGAEHFAYEVKGLELPAYDPRGAFGAALSSAIAPRGGDFTSVYARQEFALTPDDAAHLYGDARAADPVSPGGKAALVRSALLASSAVDALGACKIATFMLLNDYGLQTTAALTEAVAGLSLSAGDLLAAGERVAVLERLFDVQCGVRARDDTLPAAFAEPLAEGPHAGSTVDVAEMRNEFYRRMGWTPQGVPTAATLERLDLTRAVPPSTNQRRERHT